jgi:hypothetical protein
MQLARDGWRIQIKAIAASPINFESSYELLVISHGEDFYAHQAVI